MNRIRCILAGVFIGEVFCSGTFAVLTRFFIGHGSLGSDIPIGIRGTLFTVFLLWAVLPGSLVGLLAGISIPVDKPLGPLNYFVSFFSALIGVVTAWTSQWPNMVALGAWQIVGGVGISLGLLLVGTPFLSMTIGARIEAMVRNVRTREEPDLGELEIGAKATFRMTLVGMTASESDALEKASRQVSGAPTFDVIREPSAAAASFSARIVHAIVFCSTGIPSPPDAEVAAVRSATALGTCRVYLLVPSGSPTSIKTPLDDLIQRTEEHDCDTVASQAIAFFREADVLNRHRTIRGLRDLSCLRAYALLKLFWPLSYVSAVLHGLNAMAFFAKGKPAFPALLNPYVVWPAVFFGAFFVVHCIFVVVRNVLLEARIVRALRLGFAMRAAASCLAAAATVYSIRSLGLPMPSILTSAFFAACAYSLYLYSRRIRAECTSLSGIQAMMKDPARCPEILLAIGLEPSASDAFPFFPFRSRPLFISYMHGSAWSSKMAFRIGKCMSKRGVKTFLDRSSIESGSLWRQSLLRAVSECGCFVAVLDGEAEVTDWVLAESAYATILRKSIGKPRILLVVRNAEGLAKLAENRFGVLYMDVLQSPPESCHGAKVLIAEDVHSASVILDAIEEIRPMALLPGWR